MIKVSIKGAIALGLIASTSIAHGQRPPPVPVMRCPSPQSETVAISPSGPNAYNPNSPDFGPLPANVTLASGLNDRMANRYFRHSFRLRSPGRCCQIMSATLTIVVQANEAGSGLNASNAGNDSWSIRTTGGGAIAGHGGPVYTPNGMVNANEQRTITVNLNAATIAHMNATNRLSFLVQDDSAVLRAMVRINRCCLNTNTGSAADNT